MPANMATLDAPRAAVEQHARAFPLENVAVMCGQFGRGHFNAGSSVAVNLAIHQIRTAAVEDVNAALFSVADIAVVELGGSASHGDIHHSIGINFARVEVAAAAVADHHAVAAVTADATAPDSRFRIADSEQPQPPLPRISHSFRVGFAQSAIRTPLSRALTTPAPQQRRGASGPAMPTADAVSLSMRQSSICGEPPEIRSVQSVSSSADLVRDPIRIKSFKVMWSPWISSSAAVASVAGYANIPR